MGGQFDNNYSRGFAAIAHRSSVALRYLLQIALEHTNQIAQKSFKNFSSSSLTKSKIFKLLFSTEQIKN